MSLAFQKLNASDQTVAGKTLMAVTEPEILKTIKILRPMAKIAPFQLSRTFTRSTVGVDTFHLFPEGYLYGDFYISLRNSSTVYNPSDGFVKASIADFHVINFLGQTSNPVHYRGFGNFFDYEKRFASSGSALVSLVFNGYSVISVSTVVSRVNGIDMDVHGPETLTYQLTDSFKLDFDIGLGGFGLSFSQNVLLRVYDIYGNYKEDLPLIGGNFFALNEHSSRVEILPYE